MSTKAPTSRKDGVKSATVKRAANITMNGETMAVIMFEGDDKVYVGSPSGRYPSDLRAFVLTAKDAVRYTTHPGSSANIDKVELVFNK